MHQKEAGKAVVAEEVQVEVEGEEVEVAVAT